VKIRCIGTIRNKPCGKNLENLIKGSEVEIEIKCPRCKETHTYKVEAPEAQGKK